MPKSSTETTQEFGSIVSIPETREVLYGAPHLSDLIPDVASSRRRLNNYRSPFSERGLLLLGGDILAALCATFLAYTIWHIIVRQSLVFETGTLLSKLYWFPAVILLWMAFAWVNDMYDATRASTGRNLAQQIIAIWGSSLGIGILAYYLLPDYAPRTFVLLFLPTMAALVGLWRTGFAYFGPKLSNLHRVLMIGEPHAVAEMAAVAHQSQSTYHVAAWASVPDLAQFHFDSNGVGFLDLVRSASIREVVVSSHLGTLDNDLINLMVQCQAGGIRVTSMPDVYRLVSRQIPVKYVDHDWVLHAFSDRPLFNRVQMATKRAIDLLGSLIALPIVGLILPVAALAIRLDSRGPIFYSQIRSGRGGQPFRIYKFRTMRIDAESDGVARWAGQDDPRITKVGKFLRKTRIDELPQLWNVFCGDMSLVGPRPERPQLEVELLQELPHYSVRHMVKPGVTGWAQIHYKYGNSKEDALRKLQYDFYYIRYWSLMLDFYVLLRTVGVVLGLKGQ